MGNLVASLLNLAPVLIGPTIRAVEAIFGPKTGETKMEAVVEALTPVLEKAAAAGKIPGIPDEATLRTVIESVFQKGKADGTLDAKGNGTSIRIPAGSVITIELPEDKEAAVEEKG